MEEAKLETEQERDYRPCIENSVQRPGVSAGVDQCDKLPEMDDSQLFGASETVPVAPKGVDAVVGIEAGVTAGMSAAVKRRRGRPPRALGSAAAPRPLPPPPAEKRKKDEEDVCFICFDGGSLVLCDRRGCPKAYHPACIKRDDAFFRSKAKWNCGWHICSSCQKASLYMCYTCTYSLCKGCTRGADYVCVRGNKGFCGTCMRTIMLIENIALGNKETVEVDFDDQTSWEYLFKVYWIFLKKKLSLTLDELTKAKNPWIGDDLPKVKNSWKGAANVTPKAEIPDHSFLVNDDKASCIDKGFGRPEEKSKRRKTNLEPNVPNDGSFGIEKKPLHQGTTWATKELLEFVSHMRNGDTSRLSQFDVQALLLEYIKRNSLRDPHQKAHILCDSRLMILFGKSRVGHFEMLKLLEYHFLLEEKSPVNNIDRVGAANFVSSEELSTNHESQLMMGNGKRRKTRRKTDEPKPVANSNPNDYAAIDVHNISLLYLKRDLVENLMDDADKFRASVAGSFVRIRISCGDQKQDMYRLVQVIGTRMVAESYQIGTKTTNIMLEILNLDKKEIVSIDGISNQEFSEDECKRLRQSIKCGLIKRLKVGEIQQKAMVLRAVKINDVLEAEILRLNHLRDRANEKGRRKDLRECVEKLEILKSPEELNRRLLEIPIVHADQHMDPTYESGEDAGEANGMKKGKCSRSRNGSNNKKGLNIKSSLRALDVLSEVGIMEQRNLAATCCQSQDVFCDDRDGATWVHDKVNKSIPSQGGEALSSSQNLPNNQIASAGSLTGYWSSQTVLRAEQSSGSASAVVPPSHTVRELPTNDPETDKLWHYQDPTGKIQGPFPMMQLRKWSISGHFPSDLRVWRISEKQDDAILLTDALIGKFHGQSQLPQDKFLLLHGIAAAMDDTDKKWELSLGQNSLTTLVDNSNANPSRKTVETDGSVRCKGNNQFTSDEWPSLSSSWTTAMSVAMGGNRQAQTSVQGWDLKTGVSSSADQAQVCSSFFSSSSSVKLQETPACHASEGHGNENCSGVCNLNDNTHKSGEVQTSTGESNEKQADSEGHSSQSSGRNWRPPPSDDSLSRWDSNSKPIGKSKQNQEINYSDLPSPTPKQSHSNSKDQAAEGKLSIASNALVKESGLSWSTTSSLVIGGAQLPEVAGEWSSYSSAPTKAPIEEWDSNLASASSLKPTEVANNHAATPTSEIGHFTHSSPANLAVDTSGWQPIVPESNEFSLVDESVSDLLAEVEAMESLGGLPSPTSKMRYGELTQDSDDDCFSPVEGFSPALDPGKSDAFSSTGDIQMTANDDPLRLRLFDMPSHSSVTDEPIKVSQVPSKLTATDQPHNASHAPPQSIVIGEPICASGTPSPFGDELHQAANMPSQSTVTDKPLEMSQKPSETSLCDEQGQLLQAETIDPPKNYSGQSSTGNVLFLKSDAGTEIQPPPPSNVSQGDKVSEIHPPTPFAASLWEAMPDVRNSASPNADACRSNFKGNANIKENANLSQSGVSLGDKNMDWGVGHGAARQQHVSASVTNSTGNPGGWGSQPRYGGDRFGGTREHRNYQGRDSGYGRDRSSWNRQPLANGGGSLRPPPKGQRVCKFYESGYCRKGASCSYWHP